MLLASPFSTVDLPLVAVVVQLDTARVQVVVVVVKDELRLRPDWDWCEAAEDLKVGVTVAEGLVEDRALDLSDRGLIGTVVVEEPGAWGKGVALTTPADATAVVMELTGFTWPTVGVVEGRTIVPEGVETAFELNAVDVVHLVVEALNGKAVEDVLETEAIDEAVEATVVLGKGTAGALWGSFLISIAVLHVGLKGLTAGDCGILLLLPLLPPTSVVDLNIEAEATEVVVAFIVGFVVVSDKEVELKLNCGSVLIDAESLLALEGVLRLSNRLVSSSKTLLLQWKSNNTISFKYLISNNLSHNLQPPFSSKFNTIF